MFKKIIIPFIIPAILFAGCGSSSNDAAKTPETKKQPVAEPVKEASKTIQLKPHTDDGKPYFAYILMKGDSTVCDIQSNKPLAFAGSTNTVIQLDSSRHLTVNASALTVYINAKTTGKFPIVLTNAGKDDASVIGSFDHKDGSKTPYTADKGFVTITKWDNTCSGTFDGVINNNNQSFTIKGEFLNAKIN